MKKTLLFAAGLLLSAGSLWAEVPEGIVVTPTPGTVTEEISEIEINVKGLFPEGSYGIYYATVTYNSLSITSNNGYKAENVPLEVVNQTEGTVKVTLENPISGTENGTYTVTTNFESFKYYGESNAQTPVPNFEFNYVVGTGEGGGSGDDPDNPGDDTVEYMDPPEGYKFDLSMNNQMGDMMPGTYDQIKGAFDLQLSDAYSSVTGFDPNKKGSVIDAEGNTIGTYGVSDYGGGVDVFFTVNPAIEAAGEYYLVYPYAGCKATPKGGGEEITMKDMKIGPYIIKGSVTEEYMDPPVGYKLEKSMNSIMPELTPGNYKQLAGSFNLLLSDAYSSVTGFDANKKGRVINAEGETIAEYGVMDYEGGIDVMFTVNPAITEAGEYYLVYPYAGCTATPKGGGEEITMKDMKIGPYVIEAVEPVPAEVTYSPEGEYVINGSLPTTIALTITNSKSITYKAFDNCTLTGPTGAITLQNGHLSGSSIVWNLPEDWESQGAGTYTVSITTGLLAGTSEDDAPLSFPEDPYTWTFTLKEAEVFPTESLVPAGLVVAPEAGEYESVETVDLTFNETCLPDFYGFFAMTTKATVWNKATDEKTTVTPGALTNSNKTIPYTLNLTEEGEYAVIFDFTDAVYVSNGTSMNTNTPFPEGMQKVVLLYTIKAAAEAPEIPDVVIGSEAVSEDTYEIEEGKSVTVTLDGGEGVDVYYKWTAAKADTPAAGIEETTDWTLYTDPLEIDGAGDLSYYAEKDGVKSEEKTLSFTVKEAQAGEIPAEIESITPAPGTYKTWDATEIVIKVNGFALLGVSDGKGKMTIVSPSGESTDLTSGMEGFNGAKFNLNDDLFKENGTYTVNVDLSECQLYETQTGPINAGPVFTYKYILDVSTGVAVVAGEAEDAVYYDLNGRRLKGELVPGIYVKNVNGKVSKVIVK